MSAFKDLTGMKFNSLTILKLDRMDKGRSFWLCKCDCSKEIVVKGSIITRSKSPQISCRDCFLKRISLHGMSKTKEFFAWRGILSRCDDSNCKPYKDYGGRGISYCKEWKEFNNFLRDMGNAPSKKHTIERINVNGNYEPGNCKWATMKEQANNKTNSKFIEFNGQRKTISEWAQINNIPQHRLYNRIRRGWDINKAIMTPSLRKTQTL